VACFFGGCRSFGHGIAFVIWPDRGGALRKARGCPVLAVRA